MTQSGKSDPEALAREKRAEQILKSVEDVLSGQSSQNGPQSPRELADRAAAEGSGQRTTLPFKKK